MRTIYELEKDLEVVKKLLKLSPKKVDLPKRSKPLTFRVLNNPQNLWSSKKTQEARYISRVEILKATKIELIKKLQKLGVRPAL